MAKSITFNKTEERDRVLKYLEIKYGLPNRTAVLNMLIDREIKALSEGERSVLLNELTASEASSLSPPNDRQERPMPQRTPEQKRIRSQGK